ncbi:MAG: lactate utilization protein [Deltaproteobacteria bacterium]|nr:MAG: lactate utilization protein [Deltaproteobacteria bacterium]
MDEIRKWFYETRADETVKNLRRHGFDALQVPDRSAACSEILKRIPSSKTVGIGGSVTVREIGILDKLKGQGNTLYDHWKEGLGPVESLKIRKAQQSCDLFLGSSNAVTMAGEIVSVDGFCNRISSMAFGPKEVILAVGRNKIVRDVPAALARIKEVAAPMNARRFGLNSPCVQAGRCVDCDSPERICRGTLILERKPFATEVLVVIVQEELGY